MKINFIEQLESTNSTKEKIKILENNKDNELLKKILKLTYSGDISFWTNTLVKSTEYDTDYITLDEALDLSMKVVNREITGHSAIKYLTNLHSRLFKPKEQDIFERIISKDLRVGINKSSITKVFPDLILDPPYLRCSGFSKQNMKNIKYPAISQTKADGKYISIIIDNNIDLLSRSGKTPNFNLPDDLQKSLLAHANMHVLIGECLAIDLDGNIMNREESNGYLNSKNVDSNRVIIFIWDILSLNDYRKRSSDIPYSERIAKYENIIYKINYVDNINSIKVIPSKICQTFDECIDHFKEMLDLGQEGTIIKNLKALWRHGTSKEQIKLKIEFICELKIVGKKLGTGKNKNKLGALICASSDDILKVNVGSGFTDKQRDINFDINSIISVKSNGVLNKGKHPCLFLPIFVEHRDDKEIADNYEQIKQQQQSYIDSIKLVMKSE